MAKANPISGAKASVSLLHHAVKEDLWHNLDDVEHETCGGKAKWSGIQHGHVATCLKCGYMAVLSHLKDHDKIPNWRRRQKLGFASNITYGLTVDDPVDGYTVIAKGSRVVDTPKAKVCECGAAKTGIKPHSPGHAHYCPVKAT